MEPELCPECQADRVACDCRKCPHCECVAQECTCPRCPGCRRVGPVDDPTTLAEGIQVCECQPCMYCGRQLIECHERVDQRFPDAARAAYAKVDRTHIPKCAEGQRVDVAGVSVQPGRASRKGSGWNWDRARFHSMWAGTRPTEAERRGFGLAREAADRAEAVG